VYSVPANAIVIILDFSDFGAHADITPFIAGTDGPYKWRNEK